MSNEIKQAIETLMAAMKADPEYAWSWHCNIAMPIMDATGVSHATANKAAAFLMSHLFDCDITTHPQYTYGKSSAQEYTEFRIAAERAEDAAQGIVTEGGDGTAPVSEAN